MKEMTIEAFSENADAVIGFINGELDAHGCGYDEKMSINVAVDEIFANIAHYAYGESGDVTVRISFADEPLTAEMSFADSGVPFDPIAAVEPDTALPIEEREIGGMGIHIVKNSMDSVSYEYRNGKNILTITKKL